MRLEHVGDSEVYSQSTFSPRILTLPRLVRSKEVEVLITVGRRKQLQIELAEFCTQSEKETEFLVPLSIILFLSGARVIILFEGTLGYGTILVKHGIRLVYLLKSPPGQEALQRELGTSCIMPGRSTKKTPQGTFKYIPLFYQIMCLSVVSTRNDVCHSPAPSCTLFISNKGLQLPNKMFMVDEKMERQLHNVHLFLLHE